MSYRGAFPKAPHWLIELLAAFARNGGAAIEIGSRIPRTDFEAAVFYKLSGDAWPLKPRSWKPSQSLKKSTTIAIDRSLAPRRTGKKRPTRCTDRDITLVINAIKGAESAHVVVDRVRAQHHRPPLTAADRRALADALSESRSRTDLRAQLTPFLRLKSGAARRGCFRSAFS